MSKKEDATPAEEKKRPDTVRKHKSNVSMSTQRFLPVAEIRNDTLLLKNGGMRAVLEVEAINFNLKSETEQKGIIAGYGAFLNTLNFPLQILIRSTKTNIDEYLSQVEEVGLKHENELLKQQTQSYVRFMRQLLEVADIMQKKFYVVVPVDRSLHKKGMMEKFFDWFNPDDTSAKASARNREFSKGAKELRERVDLVSSGLANVGLHPRRLNTQELVELLYRVYNPKTSQTEKLPKDQSKLNIDPTVL